MLRFDIINWLIEKYGYKSYLEIGVADGECFDKVGCKRKVGIDPELERMSIKDWKGSHRHLYNLTSDEYFTEIGTGKRFVFDIVFIDGDHHEWQVMKDIYNSLKHLAESGTIVIHDCNSPTADHAAEEPTVKNRTGDHYLWNGTVWKAFVKMRILRTDLVCRCVDTDWGCGIIQRGEQRKPLGRLEAYNISFEDFDKNRATYLNLITPEAFKTIYDGG